VNYPFDDADAGSFNDAPTPDDLLFEEISSRYAVNNTPMFTNPVPSNAVGGIINGSLWFTISGGMIDWNYRYLACNEVTLELHADKNPPSSQIDQFWADNQNAMLAYLASVHMGVRGVVTDADTGQPVYAEIRVQGNAQPVFTDPRRRRLPPHAPARRIHAHGFCTGIRHANHLQRTSHRTRRSGQMSPFNPPPDLPISIRTATSTPPTFNSSSTPVLASKCPTTPTSTTTA
jgi:hypothetical protein